MATLSYDNYYSIAGHRITSSMATLSYDNYYSIAGHRIGSGDH
jgi:hypothetical protein